MDERNNDFDFDFMPIGQAIKKAREAKGVTREQLAEIVDYSARHLQSVENEGQHPSFELFIQLITMFDVSVDPLIFPDKKIEKSSVRRRLETLLDKLNDKELTVIEATANGLVAPTRKTGGSTDGYKPLMLGQRLKALAFALLQPLCF